MHHTSYTAVIHSRYSHAVCCQQDTRQPISHSVNRWRPSVLSTLRNCSLRDLHTDTSAPIRAATRQQGSKAAREQHKAGNGWAEPQTARAPQLVLAFINTIQDFWGYCCPLRECLLGLLQKDWYGTVVIWGCNPQKKNPYTRHSWNPSLVEFPRVTDKLAKIARHSGKVLASAVPRGTR